MKLLKLFGFALGLAFFYTHSFAAVVKELSLEEMCAQSHTIFSGTCIKKGMDGKNVLLYTFKVLHMIKGQKQDTVTIRMHKAASAIARAPSFEVDDEVILFLYPESSLGFTSPVGFGQGKFFVATSSDGKKTVTNERNNTNLFKGFALPGYLESQHLAAIQGSAAARSGPVGYQAFLALLKAMLK